MSYNIAGKMCVGPIEQEDDKKKIIMAQPQDVFLT